MVQLNGAGPDGNPPVHLPPRPSSRGARGGRPKEDSSTIEKRGPPHPNKYPKRYPTSVPHRTHLEGEARREPVGEERGLPSFQRRTPSPKCRAESPASVASTRASEAPSRRRHRPNGAYQPYPDQYGPREMYDSQSQYYYYYQNYQKYLEQHPYYREYYRQYYGRYGYGTGESLVDDKTSTRSGRSSVNDELKKSSLSSQFRDSFLDEASSLRSFEPSSIYPERGSFSFKSLPSGDVSGVPSVTDEVGSDAPHRMSPQLFMGPHLIASFTSGGKLLLVLPNDPKEGEKPTVQVRNVQKMLTVDKEYASRIQKLRVYLGPLTVEDTHKDTVVRFCESKAKEALIDDALPDRESVVLMWEYLSLLVKQNGNVCGADLANLLIRKRSATTPESGSSNTTFSTEQLKDTPDEASPQDEGVVVGEGGQFSQQKVASSICQEDLLDKFTEYLCLGRKKEAVDYAMREGLWSYAMTLASKMDPVTRGRVMSAFIHSIPSTNVLQTLIQHLSGKKPEVTKNYCEKRWGDWRLHLAMIVSNPTGHPQRDKSSMIALGDTLAAQNHLHAAHLCYLAAEIEWGTFSDKDSKLVLIGSSPHQPFQLFASDDAIQCTEIYEFARSLDSNNPMFRTFQSYKLIYALRLAECGFPNEALKYCEVISAAVVKQPSAFQVEFVSQVLELASQLKYHDVHYQMGEGEVADMLDPDWIQNLQSVLYRLQCQAAEAANASTITTSQRTDENHSHAAAGDVYSSADVIGVPHSGLDYDSHGLVQEQDQGGEQISYLAASVNPDINNEISFCGISRPEYEERANTAENTYDSQPPSLRKDCVPAVSSCGPRSLPVEGLCPQQPNYHPYLQTQQSSEPTYSTSSQAWTAAPPHHQQHHWQSQPEPPDSAVPQDQLHSSVANPPSSQWQVNQQPYQNLAWQLKGSNPPQWQQQQQGVNAEPSPVVPCKFEDLSRESSPSTPVHHAAGRSTEEDEYWTMMTGKDGGPPQVTDQVDSVRNDDSPRREVDDDDEGKAEDKKGFFGSLFGGWRKGTNQAKLPDDKNPSIVWDDQKKKWVNKDGEDSDDVPPPPPPSSMGAPPPSSLNSWRGATRKSRYVDPVGEKGRTKPDASPMLPPMPGASATSMTGMIPTPPHQEQPMEGSQAPPQNFAPPEGAKTAGTQPTQPLSHPGVEEIKNTDGNSADSIPMMTLGTAQAPPMFMNSSQFRPPSNGPSSVQPKRTGPARRAFNVQR